MSFIKTSNNKILMDSSGNAITAEFGITPTGTKSITANGIFDVTNYASANVQIGGAIENSLVWDITFTSASSSDIYLTTLSDPNKDTILAHKDDTKMKLIFVNVDSYGVTYHYNTYFSISSNLPLGFGGSSSTRVRTMTIGNGYYYTTEYGATSGNSNQPLYIDSSGCIRFLKNSKFMVGPYKYRLIMMW